MSKGIPMEVKVIAVGVGVLVLWHLFSGKDDPEFEVELGDDVINSKLKDIRYSLAGFKNDWELIVSVYSEDFQHYEEYWASGKQSERQARGDKDNISQLLDEINDFRLKCRHEQVMKEIVNRKEHLENYENEELDFVHRECMLLTKTIRSQASAWDARLSGSSPMDPVDPPGAELVGEADTDDVRLNLPFMAIEDRAHEEHWTTLVSAHSRVSELEPRNKTDPHSLSRKSRPISAFAPKFSGKLKYVLTSDEQKVEVANAIVLTQKQALASAVSDVHGGDNVATDQDNAFNVSPGDARQTIPLAEVLRDTNIQVEPNPNQNEGDVPVLFSGSKGKVLISLRIPTEADHPEEGGTQTLDAVDFNSASEPNNDNVDIAGQRESQVPLVGLSRENRVPVIDPDSDDPESDALFQSAETRPNSPEIGPLPTSDEPIIDLTGSRSPSPVPRASPSASPEPPLPLLARRTSRPFVSDLSQKAKRRKANPITSNVQASNFESAPAEPIPRTAASVDPISEPRAVQTTQQIWEEQRTVAERVFKSVYKKFKRLIADPSKSRVNARRSTLAALNQFYKQMGGYRNKVAEITKNKLNDAHNLNNIETMFRDAYEGLQKFSGRRKPPPAPIKGAKRVKDNNSLRRTGSKPKKKKIVENRTPAEVRNMMAQGNPQVTRPRNAVSDEVIQLAPTRPTRELSI